MSNDVFDYLPIRLIVFKNDDEIADLVLLGEITERDQRFEIAFDWGGKRHYIAAKKADVVAALAATEA